MAEGHDDYTALRVMRKRIAAEDYNRIRVVLLRERTPMQVRPEKLRGLLCILDESEWLCLDEIENLRPILAWRNFDAPARMSLEDPVECDLYLYHMHAGLLMGRVLEAMVQAVEERRRLRTALRSSVTVLRRHGDDGP